MESLKPLLLLFEKSVTEAEVSIDFLKKSPSFSRSLSILPFIFLSGQWRNLSFSWFPVQIFFSTFGRQQKISHYWFLFLGEKTLSPVVPICNEQYHFNTFFFIPSHFLRLKNVKWEKIGEKTENHISPKMFAQERIRVYFLKSISKGTPTVKLKYYSYTRNSLHAFSTIFGYFVRVVSSKFCIGYE